MGQAKVKTRVSPLGLCCVGVKASLVQGPVQGIG